MESVLSGANHLDEIVGKASVWLRIESDKEDGLPTVFTAQVLGACEENRNRGIWKDSYRQIECVADRESGSLVTCW